MLYEVITDFAVLKTSLLTHFVEVEVLYVLSLNRKGPFQERPFLSGTASKTKGRVGHQFITMKAQNRCIVIKLT